MWIDAQKSLVISPRKKTVSEKELKQTNRLLRIIQIKLLFKILSQKFKQKRLETAILSYSPIDSNLSFLQWKWSKQAEKLKFN